MPSKAELVSYLADLLTIDAYLDDLGISHGWLNREEEEGVNLLASIVTKEQEQADARKSEQKRQREPQAGASVEGSQSLRR